MIPYIKKILQNGFKPNDIIQEYIMEHKCLNTFVLEIINENNYICYLRFLLTKSSDKSRYIENNI
jgi:hypothetical protein